MAGHLGQHRPRYGRKTHRPVVPRAEAAEGHPTRPAGDCPRAGGRRAREDHRGRLSQHRAGFVGLLRLTRSCASQNSIAEVTSHLSRGSIAMALDQPLLIVRTVKLLQCLLGFLADGNVTHPEQILTERPDVLPFPPSVINTRMRRWLVSRSPCWEQDEG
jgi:hypothetical protein